MKKALAYTLIVLSFVGYYLLSFVVARDQFLVLVVLFAFLFASAYFLCQNQKVKTIHLVYVGILFRVLHLFSIPNLSDDYTRFLWDGRLLASGLNPYDAVPEEVLEKGVLDKNNLVTAQLFNTLNSPDRYTIYPPINQLIFTVSAFVGYESVKVGVLVMKLFLFAFELLSLFLIAKLLNYLKLNERQILFYALNPLVIVELIGNLHFEGTMMCFTLLAFYLLFKEKWVISAVSLGLAICSKILPIIFLPLLFRRYGFKRTVMYSFIVGATVLLLFVPLINATFLPHFMTSFKLYFGLFEFNASLYYIFKWLYWEFWTGSLILFKVLSFGVYAWFYLFYDHQKINLLKASGLILSLYLFCSQSIHPWYVLGPITLLVFSEMRFALVWGVLAIFSYANYITEPFGENYKLIAFEYLIVYAWFFYEINQRKREPNFKLLL